VQPAVALAAVALAAPVQTLSPIGFGLHYKNPHGSSSLLVAISPSKPAPRLAVLRAPRRASDAVPPLVATMVTHMPVQLQLGGSRLLLTSGDRRVYAIPGGVVALAVTPDGVVDFVATLPHDLVWLTLEETAKGTLAVGLARDGVTSVDVEAGGIRQAAKLRRNGFLLELPGFRAKQIEALVVTTTEGRRFRLPLDRKEFTR
jgi:hypothetical protein